MILYKKNTQIYYEDINDGNELKGVPDAQVEFEDHSSESKITISLFRYQDREHKNFFRETFLYTEILGSDGVAYGDSFSDITSGFDSGMDVNLQDQTTPLIVAYFSQEAVSNTISVQAVLDAYTITVTSGTGFAIGQYLSIFSVPDNRFYLGNILGVATNVLTLDTPLDFDYPVGSFVTGGSKNMNVNGSVTTQIFGVRNTEERIGSAFDITRVIFYCETASTIDLSKFGDIAGGLTRGIVLRKVDGIQRNILNAKTNGELKTLMFDFDIQVALGSAQDGFTGRLTFAGQAKMGAAIRLEPGDDLQMLIQDNLTTLQLFGCVCEGHIVDP